VNRTAHKRGTQLFDSRRLKTKRNEFLHTDKELVSSFAYVYFGTGILACYYQESSNSKWIIFVCLLLPLGSYVSSGWFGVVPILPRRMDPYSLLTLRYCRGGRIAAPLVPWIIGYVLFLVAAFGCTTFEIDVLDGTSKLGYWSYEDPLLPTTSRDNWMAISKRVVPLASWEPFSVPFPSFYS
jgi:hypothetical protein